MFSSGRLPLLVSDCLRARAHKQTHKQAHVPSVDRAKLPGTFATTVVVVMLLACAAGMRAWRKTHRETRWQPDPQSTTGKSVVYKLFKNRAVRAVTITLYLMYMRLTIAALELMHCVARFDGQMRLPAEPSVVCYSTASHLSVVWLAWLVLFVVSLGFPAAAVFLLRRAFLGGALGEMSHVTRRLGFLVRDIRPQFYFFNMIKVCACCNPFALNFPLRSRTESFVFTCRLHSPSSRSTFSSRSTR